MKLAEKAKMEGRRTKSQREIVKLSSYWLTLEHEVSHFRRFGNFEKFNFSGHIVTKLFHSQGCKKTRRIIAHSKHEKMRFSENYMWMLTSSNSNSAQS